MPVFIYLIFEFTFPCLTIDLLTRRRSLIQLQIYELFPKHPNVSDYLRQTAPQASVLAGRHLCLNHLQVYFFLKAHHVASDQLPVPGAA